MKNLILFLLPLVIACSTSEDPQPVAAKLAPSFKVAKHRIQDGKFHLYLFGADTLTFTNIIPELSLVDSYEYDAIEGTPGKFKNASLYQDGKQTQVLSAGQIVIRSFTPGESIDFIYDVTFTNGERLQGSWTGKIDGI